MLKLSSLLIAASAATISAITVAQEAPQLLQRMAGTWDVQQRMRSGPALLQLIFPPRSRVES
jgi:hypothetical protein